MRFKDRDHGLQLGGRDSFQGFNRLGGRVHVRIGPCGFSRQSIEYEQRGGGLAYKIAKILVCAAVLAFRNPLSARPRLLAQGTSAARPAAPSPANDELSREAFKKGIHFFEAKQFDEAVDAFRQVPELGGYLSQYKHWFLGQALVEIGKYKDAEPELAKITQSNDVSREMKYQAQFLWAEIALRQKKYAEGSARLAPLERKWRHSYRLPEVLYRLMLADLHLGHVSNACRRARRLYSKHPAHPAVSSWGSDLNLVEVEGKKLPCKAEREDFVARVRNLQWSGESDKAHKEILNMQAKARDNDRFDLDMVLANFLVSDGSVDEALSLLVRYYPQQKSNLSFLMLLARAAARSGEYQTAVGAFERAYQLSPNSKKGREALYQAAYMSYQFQDYDGAVRKFQQFAKANPNSGLARDAEWHLAWLQYLRADYNGSLDRFEKLEARGSLKQKKNSLRERLLYWKAMSHIRLNQVEDARRDFEQIIAKNAYSYYGLAAQARLDSLGPRVGSSSTENSKAPPRTVAAATTTVVPAATADEEEKESEDDISPAVDEEDAGAAGDIGDDDDTLQPSDFKDPKMRARIDVAQKLIQLGLSDLARWELSEVEKHTRNPQYLKMLISAYEGIESFNRSATIADQSFAKEREEGGFEKAGDLWSSAYPQAFVDPVLKSAREFGVAPDWIWSIMRTESMYRPEVISPVGAKGLMQLMEYTARNLAKLRGDEANQPIDLLRPDVNIRLGAQYLARLQAKFKGQLSLVAAAYNAGPHRVESWLMNFGHFETDEFVEHIPFMETRNYVKKVVRYNIFYKRLYNKEQTSAGFLAKALGVPIPSRAATRENWESL